MLELLGHNLDEVAEPQSYQSLGDGDKQHNMAKVYSGLFNFEGHAVPYIVIVKGGFFINAKLENVVKGKNLEIEESVILNYVKPTTNKSVNAVP